MYKAFLAFAVFFGLGHLFRDPSGHTNPPQPKKGDSPSKPATADDPPNSNVEAITLVPVIRDKVAGAYRFQKIEKYYKLHFQISDTLEFTTPSSQKSFTVSREFVIRPDLTHGQYFRMRFEDEDSGQFGPWSKPQRHISKVEIQPIGLAVTEDGNVTAQGTASPYRLQVETDVDQSFTSSPWTVTADTPSRAHHVNVDLNRSCFIRARFLGDHLEDGDWSEDVLYYRYFPPAEKRYPVRGSVDLTIPEGPFEPGRERTLAMKIQRFKTYPDGPFTERQAGMIRDLQSLLKKKT